MALYDANGDYVGPGGIVVAGMASEDSPATNKPKKFINVTESGRDAIFKETKGTLFKRMAFLMVIPLIVHQSLEITKEA